MTLLSIRPAALNPLSPPPPPLSRYILKTCKFDLFNKKLHTFDCFPLSAPTVAKPSFTVVPFDNANGPAACPAHLLHKGEDGSASPVELVSGAFELFEGAAFK